METLKQTSPQDSSNYLTSLENHQQPGLEIGGMQCIIIIAFKKKKKRTEGNNLEDY
jgi:hypothetical protein